LFWVIPSELYTAGSFENQGQADYAVVNVGMLYRHLRQELNISPVNWKFCAASKEGDGHNEVPKVNSLAMTEREVSIGRFFSSIRTAAWWL
jgi:hypothetical protein